MTIMTTVYDDFSDQLQEIYDDRVRSQTFNGRTYVIQASDPYGFWNVIKTGMGGRIPDILKQNFTTTQDAWNAIQNYENDNAKSMDERTEKKLRKVAQAKSVEIL